jgi:tRNA U34 5-carboxymethylaminomethyl modifying GTPase MnmE/TrmE
MAGVTVGGIPVTLLDTAGMREAVDAAEQIGVQRSAAAARAADIVIMVTDAQVRAAADVVFVAAVLAIVGIRRWVWARRLGACMRIENLADANFVRLQAGWTADDATVLQQLRPLVDSDSAAQYPPLLLLVNKCDLAAPSGSLDHATADRLTANGMSLAADSSAATGALPQGSPAAMPGASTPAASTTDATLPAAVRSAASAVVHTSAKTGEGLQALKQAVLTLTDTPQLSGGASQPVRDSASSFTNSGLSGHGWSVFVSGFVLCRWLGVGGQ